MAFRRNRDRIDQIYILRHMLEDCFTLQKLVFIVPLDIRVAFNPLDRSAPRDYSWVIEVPGSMCQLPKSSTIVGQIGLGLVTNSHHPSLSPVEHHKVALYPHLPPTWS